MLFGCVVKRYINFIAGLDKSYPTLGACQTQNDTRRHWIGSVIVTLRCLLTSTDRIHQDKFFSLLKQREKLILNNKLKTVKGGYK